MADRTNVLITVLVLVIVILAGVLIFSFMVKPAYKGYVVEKQTEGYQIGYQTAINDIVLQVQQNRFVQIPVGGNQSLFLAPVNPQQTAPTS